MMTPITKGIMFMLTHCLALAFIMCIMRQLGMNGVPFYLVMFWQNMFALLIVLSWCFAKGQIPRTKKIGWHIARSGSGYASGSLLQIGLSLIVLNKATAISFTGPLFTIIFAVIFLRERIGWHRIMGLIVGFAGVLVVLRPGTDHFDLNMLILVGTAMLWGVTDIIIKILSRTETTDSILFYTTLVGMVVATPMAIVYWEPISWENIVLLGLLACCHLINFSSASIAYRHADLSVLMPFEFSRLVFSSILAYFVFAEKLSPYTALGSFIIVSGAVYVAYRERVRSKRDKAKTKIYETPI